MFLVVLHIIALLRTKSWNIRIGQSSHCHGQTPVRKQLRKEGTVWAPSLQAQSAMLRKVLPQEPLVTVAAGA